MTIFQDLNRKTVYKPNKVRFILYLILITIFQDLSETTYDLSTHFIQQAARAWRVLNCRSLWLTHKGQWTTTKGSCSPFIWEELSTCFRHCENILKSHTALFVPLIIVSQTRRISQKKKLNRRSLRKSKWNQVGLYHCKSKLKMVQHSFIINTIVFISE